MHQEIQTKAEVVGPSFLWSSQLKITEPLEKKLCAIWIQTICTWILLWSIGAPTQVTFNTDLNCKLSRVREFMGTGEISTYLVTVAKLWVSVVGKTTKRRKYYVIFLYPSFIH